MSNLFAQGYLGHCLSRQCGVSVIGLEREVTRVETATQRRGMVASHDSHVTRGSRQIPCDFSTPQHVSMELSIDTTPSTSDRLCELLDQLPHGVCVTGLHCCGDLTPSTLHLLHSLPHPSLKTVVILGCCYHKMTLGIVYGCMYVRMCVLMCVCMYICSTPGNRVEGSNFVQFPMSSLVRGILQEVQRNRKEFVLNVFAMRLASQETRAR